MEYILYIDFSTVSYNPEHVERQLKELTESFKRLNENIWIFRLNEDTIIDQFLGADEAIFSKIHKDEDEIDNSIIFIAKLKERHNSVKLPDDLIW